jgi:hypothetical protein
METLHRGERRGRRTFWVLLPIAAVLAGGAALAKNSDVVRRVWTGVAETVGVAHPAEKSAPSVRLAKGPGAREGAGPASEPVNGSVNDEPTAGPAEIVTPPEVVSPRHPPAQPPVAPRPHHRPEMADRASAPAPSNPPPETVETAAPAAPGPNDGEAASLELYKNAYRLHFVERRYTAALAAWDEYLRSASNGRLVVEARYNRAIALVRLGRRAEAEAVLTPFARGEVSGGYRAREARELIEALNASGP